MKYVFGLILTISCCLAFAQLSEDALLGVHELNLGDVSDQSTDQYYEAFEPFSGALSISGFSGSTDYIAGYMHFKQEAWLVRGGLRRDDQSNGNLQLRFKDALVLGAYRPAWAQGLVFSAADQSPRLLNPPHPLSYAPLGLALKLQYNAWAVLATASAVERDVQLVGESIVKMPRRKGLSLASTDERIGAFGLVYTHKRFDLGTMYYRQSYNLGFTNPELDSVLKMGSAFIMLKDGNNTLQAELALQGGPYALKTQGKMHSGNLDTRVAYTRIGKYQRPAYSAKPLLLSSLDEREEILAELDYKLLKSLSIAGGTVVNHRRGSLDDPAWLAQSSIRLGYRDRDSRLSFALKLIDREVLSEVDSSYVNSKPLHLRIHISGAHSVNDRWNAEFNARFHHQEKIAAINNGSYWAQHLVYALDSLKLKAGFSILSSANFKMLVITDNDLGYEVWGKSNVQAELDCTIRLKSLQIAAKAQQELQHNRRTKLSLRLSSRFS